MAEGRITIRMDDKAEGFLARNVDYLQERVTKAEKAAETWKALAAKFKRQRDQARTDGDLLRKLLYIAQSQIDQLKAESSP